MAHIYTHIGSSLIDIEEAKRWGKKAALSGHAGASYELSEMVCEKESIRWLSLAAELGDSEAKWCLANVYASGDKKLQIDSDPRIAFKLYREASEAGFKSAYYDYAIDLITGDADMRNVEEGLSWMNKAAANDCVEAIHFYENAYAAGAYGIKKDESKFKYWREKRIKLLERDNDSSRDS